MASFVVSPYDNRDFHNFALRKEPRCMPFPQESKFYTCDPTMTQLVARIGGLKKGKGAGFCCEARHQHVSPGALILRIAPMRETFQAMTTFIDDHRQVFPSDGWRLAHWTHEKPVATSISTTQEFDRRRLHSSLAIPYTSQGTL